MSRRAHGLRLGAVALIVMAFGFVAFASPVGATTTTSVTVHARICPVSGVTDLFKDCHGRPVTNATFKFDFRTPKHVNTTSGNVSFNAVAAGDHHITLTGGDQPNEFLHLRAFCSNANTGSKAIEEPIHTTPQASFPVSVQTGQHIVCDVYWIPESGQ